MHEQEAPLVGRLEDEQALNPPWHMELELPGYNLVRFSQPQFGVLTVGLRAEGFNGWSFKEAGGGGVVTLPYVTVDEELFVGLIQQHRPLQGGLVWNAVRGFSENPFDKRSDAVRETAEELGYAAEARIVELEGARANWNSAFHETPTGEGVAFFAFRVDDDEIVSCEEESLGDERVFRFGEGLLQRIEAADRVGEMILQARFIHWKTAAGVADMFTNAAVARLLATIT
jgi:hypothetical protein